MPAVLPLIAFASAILAIAASLAGPSFIAAVYVFKPLTTLLVIAYAWPRGGAQPKQRRFIRIGLVLSLIGDVCLMWPVQGFLPGLVAFLLAHLAYIAAFCVPVRLAARPLVFVVYALIAAAILLALWAGVPAPLRAPVLGYVVCLATMAAQSFVWWRSSRVTPAEPLARWAALGGALFMLSDGLLATNKFALPLPLPSLWILASYWAAQWAIASSLAAKPSVTSP